jgi:hypothetical protein
MDTYGILAAFGRDCAGAIMVLPGGDRPGGNAGSGYSPMSPGDLQRVIGALDVAPLGAAPERRPIRDDPEVPGGHIRVRTGADPDRREPPPTAALNQERNHPSIKGDRSPCPRSSPWS